MKGLELDFENHLYRYDGRPAAGVSEILTALGIVDRSYFEDFARDRGIAVHTALEYHMTGGVDLQSLDDRLRGYVEAGIQFLVDAGVKPGPGTVPERPLFHPLHRYAGTPDVVAVAFGKPSVIDYKSGGLGAAGMATAAYEMLARVHYPLPKPTDTRRRIAVLLKPDGRYKKEDLADGFDYAHWQSAVSLYNRFHYQRRYSKALAALEGEVSNG